MTGRRQRSFFVLGSLSFIMRGAPRDTPSMPQLANSAAETTQPHMPAEMPETDWLARARAGDAAARERLVREHFALVERLLRRILGRRPDLEDLVQTVFVETLRALPRFEGRSKLSTFIGGITVKVAMRALRKAGRGPQLVALPDELDGSAPDPERRVGARRQLASVREILASMSEVKRVAFSLWALDGMAIEEVAELMGASVPATRSRIFYAQKELKHKATHRPELRELIGGRP